MSTKEITTIINRVLAFNPAIINSNTTTNGNIIDTADFDGGINFTLNCGLRTDGVFTPKIEESDSSIFATSNEVIDDMLVKQDFSSNVTPETQAVLNTNNSVSKIGVVGSKRYVRLSIVSTIVTTGATLSAICERKAELAPTI